MAHSALHAFRDLISSSIREYADDADDDAQHDHAEPEEAQLPQGRGARRGGGRVAAPAIAQAMPEVRWRLTSSFPRQLDTIFGTAQTFARYLAEATDNKFQIQTFPAGEIVGGLQALDAVQSGTVECCQTPIYFYIGKEPALRLGTGLPFGLNARQQHSWWHFGGGKEIINDISRPLQRDRPRRRAVGLPDGRLLPQGAQDRRRPEAA